MDLIGRFKLARKNAFNYISTLKRNKRRRIVEIDTAYLVRDISRYVHRKYPKLLEYVMSDIEKLESINRKR